MCPGLHDDPAPPGGIGPQYRVHLLAVVLSVAVDEASGGEVGPLYELHQFLNGDLILSLIVVNQIAKGIAYLPQVMGGDVSGHAHRDPRGAGQEQVGQPRWQYRGLLEHPVEVVHEIHGVFVNVHQQFLGHG